MNTQTNSQRIIWQVVSALIAVSACICFVLIGIYLSESYSANRQLPTAEIIYAGTLIPLAASCLLLALGCAPAGVWHKHKQLLVAGCVLGMVSSGIAVAGGIADAANYGVMTVSGSFSLLVYLLVDIAAFAVYILLIASFLGKLSHQAMHGASAVFLLINALYVLSVILYYTGAGTEGTSLLYPWSNLMAFATAMILFIFVRKPELSSSLF